jgi:S1-C subfamily serine protease
MFKVLSRLITVDLKKIMALMLIAGTTLLFSSESNIFNYSEENRPLKSMVFVKRSTTLKFVACIDNPVNANFCKAFSNKEVIKNATIFFESHFQSQSKGSAAVIGHDITRDMSYVLTAYHVCDDHEKKYIKIQIPNSTKPAEYSIPQVLIFEQNSKLELTDYLGNKFESSLVREDRENDLCLLGSKGLMKNISPVKVADHDPQIGDRIYNIASPYGISEPGAVLSFEGYFAGVISPGKAIKNNHFLFSVPIAPGSSGSILLNEDGEIISIVSYGYIVPTLDNDPSIIMWPNAAAGPTLKMIKKLIQSRIIQE